LLNSVYEKTQDAAPAEHSSQQAFREVWQKLQLEQPETNASVIPISSRRQWWKYAAAAAILLAVGLGIYRFTADKPSPAIVARQTVTNSPTDIQPGGNKAMLTLADGSVVALNDVANGVLANQGGTNVVKLANGELAYESGNRQADAVLFNTIVTPRGGKYRLTLPDGSKVWMNAESTLRYPTAFNGDTREVSLTGEAYFEIAHNSAQPFHVQVRDIKVEVLGTHFDIMAYENEGVIATTLVEGSVRVSSSSQQLQLKPGQQALQDNNGAGMKIINEVDIQQVLAWKNDYFQLSGDRLDRLMRQLERWYDVSVVYNGPVPEKRFGGKILRSSPLSDVLKALELSEVKFRVEGKTITVINN
jgi:ferric-dicitrate binding protein FerR (iron transport regulator)